MKEVARCRQTINYLTVLYLNRHCLLCQRRGYISIYTLNTRLIDGISRCLIAKRPNKRRRVWLVFGVVTSVTRSKPLENLWHLVFSKSGVQEKNRRFGCLSFIETPCEWFKDRPVRRASRKVRRKRNNRETRPRRAQVVSCSARGGQSAVTSREEPYVEAALDNRGNPANVTVGRRATVAPYPMAALPALVPQAQPGTTLNAAPDWMRQMQDHRFYGY